MVHIIVRTCAPDILRTSIFCSAHNTLHSTKKQEELTMAALHFVHVVYQFMLAATTE